MFERDALGRIIREIRNGHAIEHAYDSRSRLVRTLSGLGADLSYGYDDAGLPESVKAIVQGMPHPWEARLRHDRLGRETQRTMTGGVACAVTVFRLGQAAEVVVEITRNPPAYCIVGMRKPEVVVPAVAPII